MTDETKVMEEEVEEIEELPEIEEGQEDTTDYKLAFEKAQGMAKRFQTKLKKLAEKPTPKAEVKSDPVSKSDELDYGQKAFLVANGIKAEDEIKLVRTIMKDTGKTLEQVLESKYFQAELKERRELKQTDDATPSSSKRTSQGIKDSVEYWIAKGELPEDRELKMKVIDARRKASSNVNPFRK